jgi:hypothetical protein
VRTDEPEHGIVEFAPEQLPADLARNQVAPQAEPEQTHVGALGIGAVGVEGLATSRQQDARVLHPRAPVEGHEYLGVPTVKQVQRDRTATGRVHPAQAVEALR